MWFMEDNLQVDNCDSAGLPKTISRARTQSGGFAALIAFVGPATNNRSRWMVDRQSGS
jgi:hypothetical protein